MSLSLISVQISDLCAAFDERLHKFFTQKLATDQLIYEIELQQIKLAQELLQHEDEVREEAALSVELEKLKQQKTNSTAILTELRSGIQ